MIFACASAFDQKDFISEGSKNFLGAMVAANVAEVGAGVTDINEVVQAVHSHVKSEKKHLPVGEGAYQDPKAVMERTKDKDMHCEDQKWNDCYKEKGDYLDGFAYGNWKHPRSGAAATSMSFIAMALMFAMAQ